jgi:hypothetical protein
MANPTSNIRWFLISDVDITELKLMILAVLERHGMGPEWRRSMRGAQIGDMLDLCGGAPGARRGARGRPAAPQRQPRRCMMSHCSSL